jgi:hypothetical protein
MEGYLKISRELFTDDLWVEEKFSKAQAFIDLCNLALYKEKTYSIRGIKVEAKPGEVHYSNQKLADRWGWSRGKVIAFLDRLEQEKYIEQHRTPVLTVLRLRFGLEDCTTNCTQNWTPNSTTDCTPNCTTYNKGNKGNKGNIITDNIPPTPQGGNPSENSDLKNEGEGSNTPVEQPSPEGQKKKGFAQKRKGDAMPIEVFAAKAFPELMRDDEAAEALIQVLKKRKPSSRTELSAKLLRKKWGAYPVEYQKAAVIQSATSGYQGIFPVKDENKPGQKPGQSGQKPAYQTAQVNFKKEADLIDMIKFSDDNAAQRTYNLEMRAKLYLVRKGKDSQDPNLLKSVKEAHEIGKLNLDALDLNPTQTNA